MELHSHAHPVSDNHGGRKKWTHYLWEFLMLFLAVFAGFLAENWREHYNEHRRSQQLAVSLKNDLKEDTAVLVSLSYVRNNRTDFLDKLLNELDKPLALQNDTILVFAENELLRRSYFVPNAGTYDQIKQAGFLRYFNKDIGKALVSYESHRNLSSIQLDIENKFVLENIVVLLSKLANQKFLRHCQMGDTIHVNEPLIKKDPALLSELYGNIRFLQSRNRIYLNSVEELFRLAQEVINRLNEKYNL